MRKDRLRNDRAEIHTLGDLIDARKERTSQIAAGVGPFGEDIEIPEDIDVDEALTFPHPHHRKAQTVDLMDTPHEEDLDEDWDARDLQPTDYEHEYEEATDAHMTDDLDRVADEQIHSISRLQMKDVADQTPVEIMPSRFSPDEESDEWFVKPSM